MFTGIVEEAGVVQAVTRRGKGWSLEVEVGLIVDGVKIGDSVAVNGCCLTVTEVKGKRLIFDLLDETKEKTNLQSAQVRARVNLESSLKADGKVGGHFVTGHIDGTARVSKWGGQEKIGNWKRRCPRVWSGIWCRRDALRSTGSV